MPQIIATNTVWTSGSLHELSDVVQIAPGATLTIEPGAIVRNGSIEAYGVLDVNGAWSNLVQFDGVKLQVKGSAGRIDLDHAYINGGSFQSPTGNADYANFSLTNNVFQNVGSYIYVWYPKTNVLVEGNLFVSSGGFSVGTSDSVQVTIKDNIFVGQTTNFAVENWTSYNSSQTVVNGNSFLSTNKVALQVASGYDFAKISAGNNYFGTTDISTINAMIRDRNDGLDYASTINYLPISKNPTNTLLDIRDGDLLFDTMFYWKNNPDVLASGVNARQHYMTSGWKEGRDPNAWFDTNGYLAANPDIKAAGVNPLEHFRLFGWKEGRDPSINFDVESYLAANADIKAANINPLEHWLNYGINEGRSTARMIGSDINNGFDREFYIMSNADVARTRIDPNTHFTSMGWKEGRDPNAWFSTNGYLAANSDIKKAGINPFEHFLQFGWKEGRDPSAEFDVQNYLSANPDVKNSGINPLIHYLSFGHFEGRSTMGDGTWS